MFKVPGKDFSILDTEVTQQLYESVMAKNPSKFKNDLNPVENVSWIDAIHFCNELSKLYGLEPCYFNETGAKFYIGNNEVTQKKYSNSKDVTKTADIYYVECNFEANGFRLPTLDEWCWNKENNNYVMRPYVLGHNFMLMRKYAKLDAKYNSLSPFDSEEYVGFRIVRKN